MWEARDRSNVVPALVVRIDKGGITVSASRGKERLVVAAKVARKVVVGDMVALDDEAGRIEEILERRTVFERRSPGVTRDQIRIASRPLAANMDTVLILHPLDRGVNPSRLARELVLGWQSGAQPVVVLTKADLVTAQTVEEERALAQLFAPGCTVLSVSSLTTEGVAELMGVVTEGTISALMGPSGAGKSSLVNALAGRPVQLTAEVREGDRRGRHTTTAGQIVELGNGALLIDTPGIRGVGLWAADEGFERAFADLAGYAEDCRFRDCSHTNEPGCGLLEAVRRGDVDARRLEVFQLLATELDSLEEGLELAERAEEREINQRARRRAAWRDRDIDED